jgi:hypothetical protein
MYAATSSDLAAFKTSLVPTVARFQNIQTYPTNPKYLKNTKTVCLVPTWRRFGSDHGPFDDVLVPTIVVLRIV